MPHLMSERKKASVSRKMIRLHQGALLFLLALAIHVTSPATGNPSNNILIKGEILLGGLVPVHSKDPNLQCGALYERLGIQRLEAMLFAIDHINSNMSFLQNITLGIEVYDTCSSETHALDKALHFIGNRLSQGGGLVPSSRVVGVVGAAYSSVSIQVAHLLRLFQIPQISYDSTSFELSDKKRFEYFSRTIPHDMFQAKAIVDVVRYFNWTYISTVYSDDSYGTLGMDALKHATQQARICIATAQKVGVLEPIEVYLAIMDVILAEPLARTVVVFTSQERQIKGLLRAAEIRNAVGQLQFVGSDAWANIVWLKDLQHTAVNTITVSPKSVQLSAFEKYFTSLNPDDNTRNPWFIEYWQTHFNCSLNKTLMGYPVLCSNSLKLTAQNSNVDMRSASAIDAVHVFAHALEAMHADLCRGEVGICPSLENISGPTLLSYIRNVSFTGATGGRVKFDSNGDVEGVYDVLIFKKTNGVYKNTIIGGWVHTLKINLKSTGFHSVTSSCSIKCSAGDVMVPVKGKESCCWTCVPCNGNSYVVNQTTCVQCQLGFWPKKNSEGCDKIQVKYFGIDLQLSIPAMVFSGIGILLTVFVISLLGKNDKTPIVKASGREMAYLLLLSILCCFLNTFSVVVKPTDAMCIVRFFSSSLPFTIGYAAIFIKTNRISRIFNRRNIAKRPLFVLPSSQLLLVLGVVCVQALFLLILILLRRPTASLYHPTLSTAYLDCSTTDLDFGLSQVYNFILIIMCTIYAFKTRKIPSNFNEAKFIAFAMYSSCVVWLAFLAVYFMQTSYLERPLILCISISLIGYVLLASLYAPKVYILLFRPHRNVRRPNVPSLSLSSLNQSNTKCQKCPYAGVNMSVDGGDRANETSEDLFAAESNRMSLIDYSRPQSYAESQDGQTINKLEVEKYVIYLRKELQATKHALKTANERLRQKESEPCQGKLPPAARNGGGNVV